MGIMYQGSNSRMSQVTVHNGTVYLAGQVANDASAGMADQTRQVLENIDRLLAGAGTSRQNLLSVQIWVSDMNEFGQMNEAWDAWVVPGRPPVRACVQAPLANPQWKIEIMAIAALPESS
ncbi:RidA family protein [Marinobacterium rhizophilum]|uniref:RidA family protein n=1 Tax=Marinobacterium rhizophilum TaxID=420402 RepID=A0ABY5HKA3_9GAMM|nr:RidA family protein [Marinobacterium rhizophilum]UTW12232.1 RidA family protein [Marinobacterium rhizophilum]